MRRERVLMENNKTRLSRWQEYKRRKGRIKELEGKGIRNIERTVQAGEGAMAASRGCEGLWIHIRAKASIAVRNEWKKAAQGRAKRKNLARRAAFLSNIEGASREKKGQVIRHNLTEGGRGQTLCIRTAESFKKMGLRRRETRERIGAGEKEEKDMIDAPLAFCPRQSLPTAFPLNPNREYQRGRQADVDSEDWERLAQKGVVAAERCRGVKQDAAAWLCQSTDQ
ncbi:hypothetical protein DFH09DRAFT_1112206 [Mycena vulgaris]|nr:hypothetical protein DFH09DRAFT_1112206 [Mycena vulgaris]